MGISPFGMIPDDIRMVKTNTQVKLFFEGCKVYGIICKFRFRAFQKKPLSPYADLIGQRGSAIT